MIPGCIHSMMFIRERESRMIFQYITLNHNLSKHVLEIFSLPTSSVLIRAIPP